MPIKVIYECEDCGAEVEDVYAEGGVIEMFPEWEEDEEGIVRCPECAKANEDDEEE